MHDLTVMFAATYGRTLWSSKVKWQAVTRRRWEREGPASRTEASAMLLYPASLSMTDASSSVSEDWLLWYENADMHLTA